MDLPHLPEPLWFLLPEHLWFVILDFFVFPRDGPASFGMMTGYAMKINKWWHLELKKILHSKAYMKHEVQSRMNDVIQKFLAPYPTKLPFYLRNDSLFYKVERIESFVFISCNRSRVTKIRGEITDLHTGEVLSEIPPESMRKLVLCVRLKYADHENFPCVESKGRIYADRVLENAMLIQNLMSSFKKKKTFEHMYYKEITYGN